MKSLAMFALVLVASVTLILGGCSKQVDKKGRRTTTQPAPTTMEAPSMMPTTNTAPATM